MRKPKCSGGKHSLIKITSNEISYGEVEVVRWCSECGAVVVDTDYDGRTAAGACMKMRFPKVLNEKN